MDDRTPGADRQAARDSEEVPWRHAAAILAAGALLGGAPPSAPIAGADGCDQPESNCLPYGHAGAASTNGTTRRAADDFSPAEDAIVTSLCFWGVYAPNFPAEDAFTVTYYAGDDGLPGEIVGGPFVQGDELAVSEPSYTGDFVVGVGYIYAYEATHPPVPLAADRCYWIQVVNDTAGGSEWLWVFSHDASGNGRCLVDRSPVDPYEPDDVETFGDLAFCIDAPMDALACPAPPSLSPPGCLAFTARNATVSNSNTGRCADDFSPAEDRNISSVTFWGAYDNDFMTEDQISIRYFADAGGAPGELIAGPFIEGDDLEIRTREATGEHLENAPWDIYEYEADHPQVAVPGNTCVWIEIRNDVTAPARWLWLWSLDSKGNGFSFVNLEPPLPYDPFDAEPAHDFAFCVNAPIDTAACADSYPDLPGCGETGAGSCCQTHASPSCADTDCCNTVCLLDPFCCETEWDALCVQTALLLAPRDCGCPDLPPATCCLPGGWCIVRPYTECATIGGVYLPHFECIDNQCTSPCVLDVNHDLEIGTPELLFVLSQWGSCGSGDCGGADIAGDEGEPDGVVDVADLLELIVNWGPCPL